MSLPMRKTRRAYFSRPRLASLLVFWLSMAIATVANADTPILSSAATASQSFIYQDLRGDSAGNNSVKGDNQSGLLPDSCIAPSVPEHFRLWLLETFPEKISGSVVTLKKLSIEKVDAPVEMGDVRYEPMLGPLGSLLGRAMEVGITNLRGRYLVTVEISGTIDGGDFNGTAEGIFRGKVTEKNIKDVIDFAANKTYIAINAALFVKNIRQQEIQSGSATAQALPTDVGQ